MDNTVKVTINGKEYVVPKGMLLVDAAKSVGIEIPIFCYHPKMKPVGACRMCLVEVEKAPKLQTACTAPVADGMIVHTKSPKAIAGQNATIEFLLANHPLDCPVCDKGGECPLQDNAFGYGKGMSRFAEIKRHFVKPIPLSDKILLDRERCIMCYRCVRFTREIAGDETLTVLERGSWSQIGLMEGRTFDSPFSGNTIEICPVGALTGVKYRFRARPWDIVNVPTVCSLCPVGCNVYLTIRNNAIARVLARENPPVDDGWLCDHGRFTYEFVASPERLTQPLVRENGELRPASWEEALGLVRDRIQETMVKQGPGAIAAVGSPRLTNEELYLLQKLMRAVVGTNNLDYTFAPQPASVPLGVDAATGSIAGLERANVILLADVDPIREQPVLDLRLKKAAGKGSKLIVIGPTKTDLVDYAAAWIPAPAELVGNVVWAMLATIVQEGLVKGEFVDARIPGAAPIVESLRDVNVEQVAAAAGAPADRIREAARLYAGAGNASALYRRASAAPGLANAIADLALLTGQIGRPGAGVYPLVRDANEQGAIDVGAIADRLPGQRPVGNAAARQELAQFWGRPAPDQPGRSGSDLLTARDRRPAVVYLIGQDPVIDPAFGDAAREALAAIDFLVVQAPFLTETAKLASVVLPGAEWSEKAGTYTNLERRVQRLTAATVPPGEARPDWLILRDLGLALGGEFDYQTPTDVLAEIASTVPIYRGLTYARLGFQGVQWPRQGAGGSESLFGAADQTFSLAPVALVGAPAGSGAR